MTDGKYTITPFHSVDELFDSTAKRTIRLSLGGKVIAESEVEPAKVVLMEATIVFSPHGNEVITPRKDGE
jgi:hypothetical protein